MRKYVGLTDDPLRRRREHGNPPDWEQRSFITEREARAWEAVFLALPGYQGGTGGEGWRYGYTYTVTGQTRQ